MTMWLYLGMREADTSNLSCPSGCVTDILWEVFFFASSKLDHYGGARHEILLKTKRKHRFPLFDLLTLPPINMEVKNRSLQWQLPFKYGQFPLNHDYGRKSKLGNFSWSLQQSPLSSAPTLSIKCRTKAIRACGGRDGSLNFQIPSHDWLTNPPLTTPPEIRPY